MSLCYDDTSLLYDDTSLCNDDAMSIFANFTRADPKKKFGKGWGRAEGGGTQLKIFEENYI